MHCNVLKRYSPKEGSKEGCKKRKEENDKKEAARVHSENCKYLKIHRDTDQFGNAHLLYSDRSSFCNMSARQASMFLRFSLSQQHRVAPVTPNHCKYDHQCKSLGISEILTTRWRLQYSKTVKSNLLPTFNMFCCVLQYFPYSAKG